MVIVCAWSGMVLGEKAPYDDKNKTHTACDFHGLHELVKNGLATKKEKIKYRILCRKTNFGETCIRK